MIIEENVRIDNVNVGGINIGKINDVRDVGLKTGDQIKVNGRWEPVIVTKYETEKLFRLRTLRSNTDHDIEVIYCVTKSGELRELFSKRIYENGNKS